MSPVGPYSHQLDPRSPQQDPTAPNGTLKPSPRPQEPPAGPYSQQSEPPGAACWTPRAPTRSLSPSVGPQELPLPHHPDPKNHPKTSGATGCKLLWDPRTPKPPAGPQSHQPGPAPPSRTPRSCPRVLLPPGEPPARPRAATPWVLLLQNPPNLIPTPQAAHWDVPTRCRCPQPTDRSCGGGATRL